MIDEVLDRLYSEWLPSNDFLFVWKTQNPAGCTNKIHHPDNPVLAGMDFSPSSVTHEYHKQFWNRDEYVLTQIDERNKQLAKKLLLSKSSSSAHAHHHEAIMNKVHTLDMRMLYSRTDAHPGSPTLNNNQNVSEKPPDCLHYFAHGPLDVIGPLFQQLLLALPQAQYQDVLEIDLDAAIDPDAFQEIGSVGTIKLTSFSCY